MRSIHSAPSVVPAEFVGTPRRPIVRMATPTYASNDEGPAHCAGPSTLVSDDQVAARTFAACGPF